MTYMEKQSLFKEDWPKIEALLVRLRERAELFENVPLTVLDGRNIMENVYLSWQSGENKETCGCYLGELNLWPEMWNVKFPFSNLSRLDCDRLYYFALWPPEQQANFLALKTIGQQLMFMAGKLESLDWIN